jgi:paraquat-inducible protein B
MRQPSATLIGVFVLGAIALTVAAILFFGSGVLLKHRIMAVSYFPGSVAGLQTGAPVTYRGVRVGEVKSIGIRLEPKTVESRVRVDMELVPQAVRMYGTTELPQDTIRTLVEQDFSARLVMQSFVTGLLQVELDFRPGVPASRLGEAGDVPEIPTVPSPYQALTEQLRALDIASAVARFERTLDALQGALANEGLRQTLDGLPALVADLRQTVKTIDSEVKGFSVTGQRATTESAAALQSALASVKSLAENLDREAASTLALARGTLQNANTAIDGANVLLDPQGRTVMQIQDAVEDLAETAARLRDASERVDRDPTILIRGRRR